MIGKFWDLLFDYADAAKAVGDIQRYEICHEIQNHLQRAYDEGLSHSSVIKNAKARSKCEELVLSIPDIVVYKDNSDGQRWYELEAIDESYYKKRFDYPEEVLQYIIDVRTRQVSESMNNAKLLCLTHISKIIRDVRNGADVLKVGEKKMIEEERHERDKSTK